LATGSSQSPPRPPVFQSEAVVVLNQSLGADSHHLVVELTDEFPLSTPGQFVHLRVSGGLEPFLRRPFGILGHRRVPGGATRIELMYAVIGRGTRRLAAAGPGTRLNLLGPLGNGFWPGDYETLLLVAGGRGAVPLLRLVESREQEANGGPEVRFLFGARDQAQLWGLERLAAVPHRLATDDGSAGFHGTVVELLREELAGSPPTPVVMACGPDAMLAAVARVARAAGVPAQVSLENRMACGTGLCRGCVVQRQQSPASPWSRDGNTTYATVCKEGPVFLASEVDWQALAEI